MKEKLLTIQEAATLLQVSTKTLRRWDESGKFSPERTVGNQRRYRLSHVMNMQKPQRKSAQRQVNLEPNGPVSAPSVTSGYNKLPEEDTTSQTALHTTKQTASAPLSIFDQIKADRDKALSAPLIKEDSPFVPVAELPKPEYLWPTASAPVDIPVSSETTLSKNSSKGIFVFHSIPYRHVFVAGIIAILAVSLASLSGYGAMMKYKKTPTTVASTKGVLSAEDVISNYILKVNVPGIFSKKATFLEAVEVKKNLDVSGLASLTGGVETFGANINAGTVKVTGSNLVYSIVAGSNITVTGDPQNPTVTADLSGIEELIEPGVTSLQGQKGDVNFTGGSGILVNGTEISNAGAKRRDQFQRRIRNFTQRVGYR